MPYRRRNRFRGCARRPPLSQAPGTVAGYSNKRSRRQPTYVNAGMTSVANSSAERRVSANVMSPNANSSEK